MKKIKFSSIAVTVLALFFMGIFTFIVVDGANKVTAVKKAEGRAVTLTAPITDTTEYVTTDEDVDDVYYHVYVTYDYDGKEYVNVFYDSKETEPDIGTMVTFKIDPENPSEVLPDGSEYGLALVLSPIFLTGVSIGAFLLITAFLPEKRRDEDELCEQDEEQKTRDDRRRKLLVYLIVLALLAAGSYGYYAANDSAVFACFAVVPAVAMPVIHWWMSRKK